MTYFLKLFMICLSLLLIISCNDGITTLKAPDDVEEMDPGQDQWVLIFEDDFNYNGLPDNSKWTFDGGTGVNGWGNWELQYYTMNDLETAYVSDGTLKIRANREVVNDPWDNYQTFFSSAKLGTKCGFKYGRFDIRARFPVGFGTWPAIWMLPFFRMKQAWPYAGEIDVIEHVGRNPDEVLFSIHTGAFNHLKGTHKTKIVYGKRDWEAEFHTYSLEWTKDSLEWLIDGFSQFRLDKEEHYGNNEWPFHKHFELIMNLAIGGMFGFPPGTTREQNLPYLNVESFPKTFEIDFVKVYGNKDNMICKK